MEQHHIGDPQEVIYGGNILTPKNRSINTKLIPLQLHMSNLSLSMKTSVQYLTLYNHCPTFRHLHKVSLHPCPNLRSIFLPNRHLGIEIHGATGRSLHQLPFSMPGMSNQKSKNMVCWLFPQSVERTKNAYHMPWGKRACLSSYSHEKTRKEDTKTKSPKFSSISQLNHTLWDTHLMT